MKLCLPCVVLYLLLIVAGCGGSAKPTPIPVTGTVKFADGTVPQGEMSDVSFEPSGDSLDTKRATGKIEPDGTFKLTTIAPDDGAFPGEYKVTLLVVKTYIGRESLIAPQFTTAETTPLTASVKPGSQSFNFVVEKQP